MIFVFLWFHSVWLSLGPSTCCRWHHFILFNGWAVHYMYVQHLFFYSYVSGGLVCFLVLAIINNAATNIGIHVSFWPYFFLQIYAQGWDCSHMTTAFFVFFLRNLHTAFQSHSLFFFFFFNIHIFKFNLKGTYFVGECKAWWVMRHIFFSYAWIISMKTKPMWFYISNTFLKVIIMYIYKLGEMVPILT